MHAIGVRIDLSDQRVRTACMVAAILKKAKVGIPDHPTGNKVLAPRMTQAIGSFSH